MRSAAGLMLVGQWFDVRRCNGSSYWRIIGVCVLWYFESGGLKQELFFVFNLGFAVMLVLVVVVL